MVDGAALRGARDALTTRPDGPLAAVCVGTPHLSLREVGYLLALLDGGRIHPSVAVYAQTGRDVLAELRRRGEHEALRERGVRVVVDTCTYFGPILRTAAGVVMTDSAKWAYYAPANLGVEVVLGSTEECVRSAREGRILRDAELWGERG